LKIHLDSGVIEFPGGSIGPTTSLARFLASKVGESAKNSLTNAEWKQFGVEPEPDIGATVLFDGDAIDRVLIAMKVPSDAANDWSERVEQERKFRHDAWLRSNLGDPPYEYAWGHVGSAYDAKGCASAIIIVYER
jgi:hypothetical protein